MADVKIIDVYKSYGKVPVLKGLNFDIENGEFFVLLGSSGSGKSTTLNILAGLDTMDSGKVLFDDTVVNSLSPVERGVAMVFQNYALYPHMTVFKNMAFPLKMLNYKKDSITRIVNEVAKTLDITTLLDRYPRELSGGQAQRIALGRALVRDPKIFLLDEPLSNLDANIRSKIRNELKLMQEELNRTFIYVTHDQMEAMSLGDHIGILHNGLLEQYGKPIDIYNHPVNEYIATFLGDPEINMLSCRKNGNIYEGECSIQFKLNLEDKNITLGVRPENIYLHRQNDNDIEGKIVPKISELLGSRTLIIGMAGTDKEIKIITEESDISIGKEIPVYFNLNKCHVFNEKGENINK
ncbi:ABC transporter ATP-binding protein [Ferroplasma sp.]|uniref:ABC transporter ATP-binding protein n=1 Tax=Ferroplasma sp. TaxID=2591003 RepID=UPI002603A86F|nr:ABC transporter ATP-binding protein [Ferroplasma sp.]